MNQQDYRKLISGRSTGATAVLLRLFLATAAAAYSTSIRLRNFLYSKGWLKIHAAAVPVISIGNVTAGGTGKTPLVIWLCKLLQQKGIQCAILTRGYKTRGTRDEGRGTRTDEPAILAESCPQAEVIVNPDRVAGAAQAVNKFDAKVLILDDGFQHRRLARDVDIVAIDSTQPFGYGRLLPAGLLREPVASLKRAHATVLTRCAQTSEAGLTQLEDKLRLINPNMIIARAIHNPICVNYPDPSVIPAKAGIQKNNEIIDSCLRRNDNLDELKDKKIFAFCGIGNPDAFFSTIKGLGANLIDSKAYSDHYHYTGDCLTDIYKQAKNLKADLILTTEKDWYSVQYAVRKLVLSVVEGTQYEIPFAYLAIELRFTAGEDKLKQLIEDSLAGKIHSCKNNSK